MFTCTAMLACLLAIQPALPCTFTSVRKRCSIMTSRAEKDAVMDFAKYCDQRVRVRFQGGREVDGVLKGFDKLDNLVLDDTIEYLRDPNDLSQVTDKTRKLGQVVVRGTQVSLICPSDEMEEIANPFADEEEEEEIPVEEGA